MYAWHYILIEIYSVPLAVLKFHLLFDYYPRTHPLIFLLNKVISKDLGRPNHRSVSHFYALFRTAVWVILCPLRIAKEGLR